MNALWDAYSAVSGWTSHPAVALLACLAPFLIALAVGNAIEHGTGPDPDPGPTLRPVEPSRFLVVQRPGGPIYDQETTR